MSIEISLTAEQIDELEPLFNTVRAAAMRGPDERGMLIAQIQTYGVMRVGFLPADKAKLLMHAGIDADKASATVSSTEGPAK